MAAPVAAGETSCDAAIRHCEVTYENGITGVGLASTAVGVCPKVGPISCVPEQTRAGSSEAVARLLVAIGGRRAAS